MKFSVGQTTYEGFVSANIIVFENGLTLRSPSVLWLGKDGREEETRKFEEVIEAMKTGQLSYEYERED